MARPDGWKYNNHTNCYVKPDYADYPPLLATTLKSSSNVQRQLKVRIKTDASTKKNALANPHDTRYKNKKATKRLIFIHSPLRLPSQNRKLVLLNYTVQSPSKPPQTKKIQKRSAYSRLLHLWPKSMCSTKKCSCQKGTLLYRL